MNIPAKIKYGSVTVYYTIIDFIVHQDDIKAIVVENDGTLSTQNIGILTIDDVNLIPKKSEREH